MMRGLCFKVIFTILATFHLRGSFVYPKIFSGMTFFIILMALISSAEGTEPMSKIECIAQCSGTTDCLALDHAVKVCHLLYKGSSLSSFKYDEKSSFYIRSNFYFQIPEGGVSYISPSDPTSLYLIFEDAVKREECEEFCRKISGFELVMPSTNEIHYILDEIFKIVNKPLAVNIERDTDGRPHLGNGMDYEKVDIVMQYLDMDYNFDFPLFFYETSKYYSNNGETLTTAVCVAQNFN